jgi:DNA-binding response OmpR family regulator
VRILIADDDVVLTRLLEMHLKRFGHTVQITSDAVQTWRMARNSPPDLVLLDINMPGGTGLAVLRRLKNNLTTNRVPVIVITAAEEQGLLQSILNLRPDALLRKPVQLQDLDLEIARLLINRELARSPGGTVA